jgi:hypothetical protein
MNEIYLTELLRKRIEEAVLNMQLPTDADGNTLKAPQVVNGFLPPKRSRGSKDEFPDFPYVIVRPMKGRTGNDRMTTVDVKLLIGAYTEEFDGYEYCLHIMSVIRLSLMQNKTLRTDGGNSAFRLELPFDWEAPDDQPWPEWIMAVMTRWTIATPQEVAYDEDL